MGNRRIPGIGSPLAVLVLPLALVPSMPGTVKVAGMMVLVRGTWTTSVNLSIEVSGGTVLVTGVAIGQGLVIGIASA